VEDYLSEKEQWEWVKGQVRSSGPWVIVAVAVVFAGVAGWRWWQDRQDTARLAANDRLMQMVQALQRGDRTQAFSLVTQMERENPGSPYTDQAKLLAARVYVDDGSFDKAAAELEAVAQHSPDRELATIARQRLARVQIAQGKPDAALETLKGTDGGAFAARYHEVRGDAFYAKGDKASALTEYRSAQSGSHEDNAALLTLKIAELAGDAPVSAKAAPAASAPAPTAAGASK
jgi:predicted negative regulator of RcsB-dependent stress response